jgi:FkbM family methyltransferase
MSIQGTVVALGPKPLRGLVGRLRIRRSPARRSLERHFANGGAPVVLTDAYDMRFVLYAWELDLADELLSKAYDRPDFRCIAKLLAPGGTAVDVGANVGAHSIMMSRTVGSGGRVLAFEPVPATAWQMREHLALNKVENVELVEAAISNAPGTVEMSLFDQRHAAWNSRNGVAIDGIAPIETVDVRADTLDDAMRRCGVERINFLKIDVEGYELDALSGAPDLLAAGAVDYLCFEISQTPLEASGHEARELFALLASFGYRCFRFDEDGDRFVGPFEDSDDAYVNFYASREDLRLLR